tara:strand:+ start:300 stop:479 length:180 start_codon:yes stop_codon:yes gene_type:complete
MFFITIKLGSLKNNIRAKKPMNAIFSMVSIGLAKSTGSLKVEKNKIISKESVLDLLDIW